MSIPVNKLLEKMEQELQSAKNLPSESKVRERVHAIKTICEIILDEPEGKVHRQEPVQPVRAQTETVNLQQPVLVDDDANGESLFDF